jgi:hypothetical protein
MDKLKQVLLRILAAFAASGLGVVGAGTIAGVPLWKAVMMAGIGGVATVVERLARLYLDDGNLSTDDINAAFGVINKTAPAEEPAVVEEESTVVAKKG